ncbi:hypothetical protein [Streptodolium elevatio]
MNNAGSTKPSTWIAVEVADYLARQGEAAAARLAGFEELSDSIDWGQDPLSVYGKIALEYGRRISAAQREWADWAAAQVRAGERRQ